MWTLLAILLLASHLLAVNVAAAGPLVAAWLAWSGEAVSQVARRMAWLSLAAIGLGAAFAAPLLVAPNPGLWTALARFPASTYWFAAAELGFSAVCIAGLIWLLRRSSRSIWWAWILALATATNLLYHFPPLMAILGKLATDPRWASAAMIDHRTQLTLSFRPEILALWVHFVLASVAVAAIAALWPVRWKCTHEADESPHQAAENAGAARGLAALAMGASALQIPVGVWLLTASSTRTREALLGNDAAASVCFLGGLVAAFALLQSLAAIVMGEVAAPLRRRAAWLLAIVAVLMAATLSLGRAAAAVEQTTEAKNRRLAAKTDYSAAFSGSLLASSNVPPGNLPALINSS